MRRDAFELACRLAREAEAVCRRHPRCSAKRERRDWLLGDVHNRPGRSLFVLLHDWHKASAGKWSQHLARRLMVRVCAWGLSHRRSTASPRPAASAVREVA